jgi:hypothetical protein
VEVLILFVGWQVEGGTGAPASALVIEQPAPNSGTAMMWRWQKSGDSAAAGGPPQMINWIDASNWQMRLPANGIALRPRGNVLELHPDKERDTILELKSPPDVAPQLAELDRQFAASAAKYPRFFERTERRVKVTGLLIGIFVLQEIFFLFYKRISGSGIGALRLMNALVWIAGGIWLIGFYF